MRMYLSLCDCWGEIEMSTILYMGDSYWLDQSRDQEGVDLTECTEFVKGIMQGSDPTEYLEFIGEL